MSSGRLEAARRALRASRDVADVRAVLLQVAPEFHRDLRRRRLVGRRPDLGVHVKSLPGHYSGMTIVRNEKLSVALSSDDTSHRRRYSLAHELAHQLLHGVDRSVVPLSRDTEEDLCELFAGRALMPPALVAAYLQAHGTPANAAALFKFCSEFGVSVSAAVNTLRTQLPAASPVAILTASRRGAPSNRQSVDYRVNSAAFGAPLYIPRHRRLRTLGLERLLAWTEKAQPGDQGEEDERRLVLRSRQRRTASWLGPTRWNALAISLPRGSQLQGIGLLVFLDVTRLYASSRDPTRPTAPSSSRFATAIAGQLRLT